MGSSIYTRGYMYAVFVLGCRVRARYMDYVSAIGELRKKVKEGSDMVAILHCAVCGCGWGRWDGIIATLFGSGSQSYVVLRLRRYRRKYQPSCLQSPRWMWKMGETGLLCVKFIAFMGCKCMLAHWSEIAYTGFVWIRLMDSPTNTDISANSPTVSKCDYRWSAVFGHIFLSCRDAEGVF